MIIGLCKEIKPLEGRVAMTPGNVDELVETGHEVLVETGAGLLSGYTDSDYQNAGAEIVQTHRAIFERSEFIVRVKEIMESEYELLRDGQIVLAYFHFTADKPQTEAALRHNITAIDYEYLRDPETGKRMVTMSPVAGRLGMMLGLQACYSIYGGRGLLPMGVPGVEPAEITVLGAGDAGLGAIKVAIGLGASVNILLPSTRALEALENDFGPRANYFISNRENIQMLLKHSDVVVNCVYWDKLRSDHLIYQTDLKTMKDKSIIIDISCDINGAVETCKATTHQEPTYEVDGVIHYCVDNIPGAVPYTSSKYLAAQSFGFIKQIADQGKAVLQDPILRNATLVHDGNVTHSLVADKWRMKLTQLG